MIAYVKLDVPDFSPFQFSFELFNFNCETALANSLSPRLFNLVGLIDKKIRDIEVVKGYKINNNNFNIIC